VTKRANHYQCQTCGAIHAKWSGRCDACGGWNTLVEEVANPLPRRGSGGGRPLALLGLEGEAEPRPRLVSGIGEFDRVVGGGLVPGSAVLTGGDPGIGKSTLLLQVAAALSTGSRSLYVSGEEAVDQLRLRASRLGLTAAPLQLTAATAVADICATLQSAGAFDVIVVDSIQTLFRDDLDSTPGTVTQVRASVQDLVGLAKLRGFVLLLVGHVTKEGLIAGPKVVEHMVDTVLYFEGDRGHHFRILRAVKNRYGATDEIGVFQMTDAGLSEVTNPSALFLADRERNAAGCCVFAGIEGSRPVLLEIQSLIAPSSLATPRRAVVGWDSSRLAMVLAVLETRCGMSLANADVYLNVAGGLRIAEPAADLAVAAALVSAAGRRPLPADTVVFGEIGLAGEVRPVARSDLRLKEAAKLGFARAIVPLRRQGGPTSPPVRGIATVEVGNVADIVSLARAAPSEAADHRGSSRG
jgi:DNA repair protein RadA/Sms